MKIPVINQDRASGLEVTHAIATEGIKVSTTAILSFNQVMLAAKAGATYRSIVAGRVADEGHDPTELISSAGRWVERWRYGEILVGNVRGNLDVQRAAAAPHHHRSPPWS